MQVTNLNDVKQYNLTQGRSLPEWLDERKRRKLLSKDAELRRRIELIQDFDMPCVSGRLHLSDNGEFIIATGTYKPRVKCFDVNQLGLKFERCFDEEPVAFRLLSEDYSKMIFLHCDRYVEIHSQNGRYYRIRIPKFGRDLVYQPSTCDVFFVGDSSEVSRLNLEQGRFLNPLKTESAAGFNVCALNQDHHLFLCGSVDGKIEAWDSRSRDRVGILDCAMDAMPDEGGQPNTLPQITALEFRDNLNFGVGTSTGKVLLYDLRASKPLLVKDHMYEIPIKKVAFHSTLDQVVSMDGKVVKIWDRLSGKAFTSIESSVELNDFAVFPGTGLFVMTCEQPKMQVHYIPSMGPSPKWCSFLDNITEEMEESEIMTVYDDYKFITREELDDLGLEHLVGSKLLRAYMHGFFMDARLYRKARSLVQSHSLEKFIQDKVKAKLDEKRAKRVQLQSKLPKINKDLFLKLKDQEGSKKKAKQTNLLEDDRFKAIFTDSRFEVDKTEDAYRLLAPVVSRLDDSKKKKISKEFVQVSDGSDDEASNNDSDLESDNSSLSEDDGKDWKKNLKEEHKKIRQEKFNAQRREREEKQIARIMGTSKPKFYEQRDGADLGTLKSRPRKNASIGELLAKAGNTELRRSSDGHQMVFKAKRSRQQLEAAAELKEHRKERQQLRRSASSLQKKKLPPKFFMGRRVA